MRVDAAIPVTRRQAALTGAPHAGLSLSPAAGTLLSLLLGAALLLLALGVTGCAGAATGTVAVTPDQLESGGWLRVPQVVAVQQRSESDCGAAAAAVVVARWQGPRQGTALPKQVQVPESGLRAGEIRDLLRWRGLRAFVVAGTMADLEHEVREGRPVIVGTVRPVGGGKSRRHFEVVVAINPRAREVVTIDPAAGWRKWGYAAFQARWRAADNTTIVALPPGDPL